MRIEPKLFQDIAARDVLNKLLKARQGVADGDAEAIVLSAPTGSGKTITVAAVIDWTFGGADGILARPDTTFLWLSDSPELNAQSKGKLLAACDNLPFHRMVTIDSESFDEERLQPGHIYFINTQLLGRDKLLTQSGDKRQYTFWQTVAHTVATAPQDFILIIDEAHRGAGVNERNRKSIMQKFVTGSDADGLPAVPLVLGMSATPQRFTELLGNTNRTERKVVITPDGVHSSGLLKDLIIIHNPQTKTQSDLTLLEHAAKRWKHFWQLWESYCNKEKEKETVRPILVVQVEDGNENTLTRTPLSEVVNVIERGSGQSFMPNEIVHCFQDKIDLQYGGRIIRKLEPSRIQDTPDVRVVLFKTALNTGWDCPRAEVMMSFRRAQDPTSIAQLVGRMIRTPLARRIETDEVLNTVELFLPHYDSETLESVLKKLRSPDETEGLPARVETQAVEYARNPELSEVFEYLAKLPTYSVERAPKMGDVKRALRLAGMLVHEGIDENADERLRKVLITKLKSLRDNYAANEEEWENVVRDRGEIEVDVTMVSIGQMNVTDRQTIKMSLSEENIDQLFDAAGRMLAVGEGLHRTYWKHYHNYDKPNEAKLELFAVMRKADTMIEMEALARNEFNTMWKAHRLAVQKLPAADKQRFNALMQASGKPAQHEWELPEQIVEKLDGAAWKHHLYCNEEGEFMAKLNGWEISFLERAMAEEGFVAWLRNLPRRDWAFCVPYELGVTKPFYPDFIIVRKKGTGYEIDILEPHDDSRTDTWAKVKGLAKFADDHGLEFGRLIVGRKVGNLLQITDLNNAITREKAIKMQSSNDLESLFGV